MELRFYTRDGHFLRDAAGDMVDSHGNYLLDVNGQHITLPARHCGGPVRWDPFDGLPAGCPLPSSISARPSSLALVKAISRARNPGFR